MHDMDLERTIKLLKKPEYYFRPSQIVQRLRIGPEPEGWREVRLPWGLPVRVWANETIGRAVVKSGIHDLATVELIFRLVEHGDTVVDAGANVGIMTSAMAVCVGPRGQVHAFEPHPEIYAELQENVRAWEDHLDIVPVQTYPIALSDHRGLATLHIPARFKGNRGIAYVGEGLLPGEEPVKSVEVETATLDGLLGNGAVKLLKIDVEGHELSVLQGAQRLLEERRITHIIFEEHRPLPTPVSELLESYGYRLIKFEKGFIRPKAVPARPGLPHRSFETPLYLATLAPEQALARLRKVGWQSLRGSEHPE